MFAPLNRLFRSFVSRRKAHRTSHRRTAFCRPLGEQLESRELLAVRIWDGGAVSNNWTSANNWVGNVAPVAGDDLVFPASASDKTADNTYVNGTLFNSITMGGGYTLRGNRVSLGAGGITGNGGTSNSINFDIFLGGAGRTINVGAGSTLFIDGALSGSSLTKQGTGSLSLRANNTYGGLTDVAAGKLFVTKDEGLGSTVSGTTVRSGASLIADHSATLIGTLDIDEPLTLEGGSNLRALRQVELNGPIMLLGTVDISQEAATEELFIDGKVDGPGGMNLVAQNKLWIRGSDFNQYLGTTSVTGDIRLAKSAEKYALGFSDVIIQVNSSVTFMAPGQFGFQPLAVTIQSGGELRLNGHSATVDSLTLNGGKVTSDGLFGSLRFTGTITATSTASGPARIVGHLSSAGSDNDQIIMVADGPLLTDLIMDVDIEGGDNLVKEGPGVLELSVTDGGGNNFLFYRGDIVVNAGTLVYNGNLTTSDDNTGSLSVYNSIIVTGGRLSGTGTIDYLQVNGGRVAPGSLTNTGILHVRETAFFSPASTLHVVLDGPIAGTGHDQLDLQEISSRSMLLASVGPGASPGNQFRIVNIGGTEPMPPGFVDATTGNSIPQGGIFTTASGVKLSMDYAGGTGNDVVLTYVNTRTLVENLVVTPQTIIEGESVLVTGHLTDPDLSDQLTLLVDWGDGTPTASFHPGREPFALRHQYRDNGNYTPHLTWFDNHGEGNSRDLAVTVNNAVPQVFAGLGTVLQSSQNLVRKGFFFDPGADTWTATVDYGDGSGPEVLKLHDEGFRLRHRYDQPGTCTVTVTVMDDDGGLGTDTFTVEVRPRGLDSSLVDLVFESDDDSQWHSKSPTGTKRHPRV